MANSISFRLTNKMNCFKCFQPKVEEFGASLGLSGKVIFHLTLCLDELVTNIIDYGYADYDEHPIDVTISYEDDVITILVVDDATPFNIMDAPEPELDTPLEERERPIGGMGVHIIKNMMDEIDYKRDGDKNVLRLTKRICHGCCPGEGQTA